MECYNCGKDVVIPTRAYLNLETYNVGGTCLISSSCCGAGYIVKMNVTYKVTEYLGSQSNDDWGVKLTTKTKTNE